jgi:hypothetical protein
MNKRVSNVFLVYVFNFLFNFPDIEEACLLTCLLLLLSFFNENKTLCVIIMPKVQT